MSDKPPPEDDRAKSLPLVGITMRVWHQGRERTAYLDSEGKWRDDLIGEVLLGEVKILGPYRG